MDEEYKPSRVRSLAVRLHGAGPRLERFTDWLIAIAASFFLLVVIAWAGFVWLPITDTLFDVLFWFAAPFVVTLAVVARARCAAAVTARRLRPRPPARIPS